MMCECDTIKCMRSRLRKIERSRNAQKINIQRNGEGR